MKKQLLTDCYSSLLGNSRPSFLGKGLILSSLVMGMFWGSQAVQASTIFNQSGPFTGAPLTPSTFTDSDALDLTNTDFTISACVYQTQRNSGYSSAILAKRGSENGWIFALNGEGESNEGKSGAVKFRTNYQANGLVISNQTLTTNTWSHVAVVYQNGQAQIFVNAGATNNGAPDVTKTLPRPVATEKVLRLGGDYDYLTNQHRYRWNGTLSNLQIDNTALSQAQVQTLCTGCGNNIICGEVNPPPPPPPPPCNPLLTNCPTYNPTTGEVYIPQLGIIGSTQTCSVYLRQIPLTLNFTIDTSRLICQ